MSNHIVNSDAKPFTREGWSVDEHRKSGQIDLSTIALDLWLAEGQKSRYIEGHRLHMLLNNEAVLNATVLDHLLKHPELIPEEWYGQDKFVFFWGTIYRSPSGRLFVRCLTGLNGKWSSVPDWLGNYWSSARPAAVLASWPLL